MKGVSSIESGIFLSRPSWQNRQFTQRICTNIHILRSERDRQEDGEQQRELLTLNEPLVPTMHETNYALGLPGTSTNKLPFMLKLGNGDQNIVKIV